MTDTARVVLVEELLQARFDESEHKSFTKEWTNKRGERKSAGPFTYIEDESGMDRLDDVLGFGHWSTAAEAVSERCVKLTLGVQDPKTGAWVYHSDFGYCTNDDSPEPLKEAWTDAFRRTARLVGIARYVYAGEAGTPIVHTTQGQRVESGSGSAPSPHGDGASQAAPAAPQAVSPQPVAAATADDGGTCPEHGFAWTLQPGGTSKSTGKAYDPFWKCSGKTNGAYCKAKPDKAWTARQERA